MQEVQRQCSTVLADEGDDEGERAQDEEEEAALAATEAMSSASRARRSRWFSASYSFALSSRRKRIAALFLSSISDRVLLRLPRAGATEEEGYDDDDDDDDDNDDDDDDDDDGSFL